MTLILKKFRTTGFRSVADSGWVELDEVTALVGINESGKSNLLLSLWKLNPAREGEIDPIADYPRSRYHELRATEHKPVFVTALFAVDESLATKFSSMTGLDVKNFDEVEVSRKFDGKYSYQFPKCQVPRSLALTKFEEILMSGKNELNSVEPFQSERDLKDRMLSALATAGKQPLGQQIDVNDLSGRIDDLQIDITQAAKSSKLLPIYNDVLEKNTAHLAQLQRPDPTAVDGVWKLAYGSLPKFVYYSNYGNLDSEIYLPHVIENLEREDLGEKDAAKARTLRILFEFVKLSPKEILELGTEVNEQHLTDETIEADAKKKKEREILLTSASTQLTKQFKDWWKQGNYRFRFNADGNHFRIWVSDEIRPEEIELEGRSTGLQWFFSFYLVFLVESQESHHGTILLLDEAGLSLHPLAQRDLSNFFDNLQSQVVYTTHSPFLMEADALDRVRSVYTDEAGRTTVSADLRANPKIPSALKSIYAVHVAMGLSVSDTFLIGCLPIVVEGVSDQRYLTGIKNYLIGANRIHPSKDIVFLPAGGTGTKGVSAVVSIITAKEQELPRVLIDSDVAGDDLKRRLLSSTYQGAADRIKQVSDYGTVVAGEIEDLVPADQLANVIGRYLPRPAGSEDEFDEIVDPGKPIIPQIEAYASKHSIELTNGWKVEIATRFKKKLPRLEIDQKTLDRWTAVFSDFLAD